MASTYGVSVNGAYVDVSRTERGAKSYATRNGFNEVYRRPNSGYFIELVATKISKRWAK